MSCHGCTTMTRRISRNIWNSCFSNRSSNCILPSSSIWSDSRSFSSRSSNEDGWKESHIVMMFGANTDVGKTLASAGLIRAALRNTTTTAAASSSSSSSSSSCNRLVHYIKPLQCGGSDQSFVTRHILNPEDDDDELPSSLKMQTLFHWETPTSPHLACQLENKYVPPSQLVHHLHHTLSSPPPTNTRTDSRFVLIETAGGVLSPSSSPSPSSSQQSTNHTITNTQDTNSSSDGTNDTMWMPQASVYQQFIQQQQHHHGNQVQAVLMGDAKLGGISCTLSALESLWLRNYHVSAVLFIGSDDNEYYCENASALEDYLLLNTPTTTTNTTLDATNKQPYHHPTNIPTVFSLPTIPSNPTIPLDSWYLTTDSYFDQIHQHLLLTSNHNHNHNNDSNHPPQS